MKEQNTGGNINQSQLFENEDYKLLYDFNIRTDKKISARRPDIVVVDKNERRITLTDVACTQDKNVEDKEIEKVNKY